MYTLGKSGDLSVFFYQVAVRSKELYKNKPLISPIMNLGQM
jgi:hypothetical protein